RSRIRFHPGGDRRLGLQASPDQGRQSALREWSLDSRAARGAGLGTEESNHPLAASPTGVWNNRPVLRSPVPLVSRSARAAGTERAVRLFPAPHRGGRRRAPGGDLGGVQGAPQLGNPPGVSAQLHSRGQEIALMDVMSETYRDFAAMGLGVS